MTDLDLISYSLIAWLIIGGGSLSFFTIHWYKKYGKSVLPWTNDKQTIGDVK